MIFDVTAKSDRRQRFRRPEFQKRLKQARLYQRQTRPLAPGWTEFFLHRLGLKSRLSRWVFAAVILVVVYFLTLSEFFLVTEAKLNVDGLTKQTVDAALARMGQTRLYYLIPSNHLLIVNRERVLAALQRELPQLKSLTVFKKALPNKLELLLEERRPEYVWQTGADFYLLDQDGVIFQKILNYDPTVYPEILIVDRAAQSVLIGQSLRLGRLLNFINETRIQWANYAGPAQYLSFSVSGTSSLDMFVSTTDGFLVYFDVERPVIAQLKNLNLLLTQEIRPETYAGLSYIDLRLPDIAYYCYKDAPCALEAEAAPIN